MQEILDLETKQENEILKILKNETIDEASIQKLINTGKKDILIHLARHQKLTQEHISTMIENSPYMGIKMIVKNQEISSENKELILKKMNKMPKLYEELLQDAKELKW
ncbi:hypothetical protein [Campylobacter pinnipediorum]|uniref:hypothetical protein n=1 Tax=Campylobacter pinnipediorum TaxID=1965231 RepID=UPI00084DF7DB|nr:hypothetical protein [Campylobacter pinnipediorum]